MKTFFLFLAHTAAPRTQARLAALTAHGSSNTKRCGLFPMTTPKTRSVAWVLAHGQQHDDDQV
jgi:hypothetical protein